MTDDLIERLVKDLRPIRGAGVAARLAGGLAAGALVALAGVLFILGLRPDMPAALGSAMFWVKLAYTVALASLGAWCVERLARPAGVPGRRLWWLVVPALAMIVLSGLQLAGAPADLRRPLVMGSSAMVCPWLILAVSAPVYAGLAWALRGLAPTRLRLTGALAGLAAGGAGAAIYALHCPEAGAPFVAIWYSLGILAAAASGALLGPRLLRW